MCVLCIMMAEALFFVKLVPFSSLKCMYMVILFLVAGLPSHSATSEKTEEEVPTTLVGVANEPQRSGSLSSKLFSGFRSLTKETAKSEVVHGVCIVCVQRCIRSCVRECTSLEVLFREYPV